MKSHVVVGGPGTGKTTHLLNIVDQALSSGIPPEKIGYFSFTKKAANEAITRAVDKFQIPEERFRYFRTFHSFSFAQLGMRREKMVGWPHLRELGNMLGMEFRGRGQLDEDEVYGMNSADRLLFIHGLSKNREEPLHNTWSRAMEDGVDWFELERFSRAYEQYKRSRGLSDFNDLLDRFCLEDPQTYPRFDLLIIDEGQDCSSLMWRAIDRLDAKLRYVGGDDRQSIFSWSGASVERFIDMDGEQTTLEQSWRIPSKVHELAESIASRISSKRKQHYRPRQVPGAINWVNSVEEVDMSSGKWLLLARNGYMLEELESWCMSQGLSFHSVGRDPLKSPALEAIRIWENLRRGKLEGASNVLECMKFAPSSIAPPQTIQELRKKQSDEMLSMQDLKTLGLRSDPIWHQALLRIKPQERDFFIAARKRNEPLLKEPRIKISTIHSAKGGEADHVLLLTDVSYRTWTNAQSDSDSEARVWYVGVTRCKETLNVVSPRTNLSYEL